MLEELYYRYNQKIHKKCISFIKSNNEDEAEDLAHEILIKVFDKLHTFKEQSKFSTWLYSVTYNHLVNYIKKDDRNLSQRWEWLNSKNFPLYEEEDYDDYDYYELKASKLNEALELIEPADKALLLMKYSDNILIADILKNIDINESALKMRLKRAKARLKKIYEKL